MRTALMKSAGWLALMLAAPLVMPLLCLADVSPGVGYVEESDLTPIWIYDEDENLEKFVIQENDVRGYAKGMKEIRAEFEIDGKPCQCPDGELGVCEVCAFRATGLAISELWEDEIPNRADLDITWSHPSPCQEKTFRYITGNTAQYHKVILEDTGKVLSLNNYRYKFTNLDTGDEFEVQVKEGIFPPGFFELRAKAKSGRATDQEKALFASQRGEIRDKFLDLDDDELFNFEEEEEETPYWPIVFTLGLTAVVVGTAVYSVGGARRR
jgi:formylmethanofuran dehydrogenase subunit E